MSAKDRIFYSVTVTENYPHILLITDVLGINVYGMPVCIEMYWAQNLSNTP